MFGFHIRVRMQDKYVCFIFSLMCGKEVSESWRRSNAGTAKIFRRFTELLVDFTVLVTHAHVAVLKVHNFVDGVTIGAAFLSCSLTMGWTVTASAVLHEVPQELADFMALLNGGMSMKQVFHLPWFFSFVWYFLVDMVAVLLMDYADGWCS